MLQIPSELLANSTQSVKQKRSLKLCVFSLQVQQVLSVPQLYKS
jgi:hypothetical protein